MPGSRTWTADHCQKKLTSHRQLRQLQVPMHQSIKRDVEKRQSSSSWDPTPMQQSMNHTKKRSCAGLNTGDDIPRNPHYVHQTSDESFKTPETPNK